MDKEKKSSFSTTSELNKLCEIRRFIEDFCGDADQDRIEMLKLVVNEAAANIIRHAYKCESGRPIFIEAEMKENNVIISLYDYGVIFKPDNVKKVVLDGTQDGGMGLYIMKSSVDNLVFSRDESGKNITRFNFAL
ncbi:MAG: ATP-binding protein [Desulfobacterales bacterium]|nr:ATP-binding protein [Desulfobacterales bacterium]MBF0398478.1 ATP-binding protein [Desulfobacterales bacterium]